MNALSGGGGSGVGSGGAFPVLGSQPDLTKVRMKLHFDEEIRVVVVSRTVSFDEVLVKLREEYHNTVSFRYLDEEGDLITVRSEEDWREAMSFCLRTSVHTFKVFLDKDPKTLRASTKIPAQITNALAGTSAAGPASSPSPQMSRASPGQGAKPFKHSTLSLLEQQQQQMEQQQEEQLRVLDQQQQQQQQQMLAAKKQSRGSQILRRMPLNWQLGEKIGAGAFGQVYKVMNSDTGEIFAMKQVRLNQETNQRQIRKAVESLMHEIELMQDLSHPNIVSYLGSERREDSLNIFMEFVSGGSIAGMLQKFSAFPEKVTMNFTKQILEGLRYLHEKRIIHRDLKGESDGSFEKPTIIILFLRWKHFAYS